MEFCVMSGGQCIPSGHVEKMILSNNANLNVWGYSKYPVGYKGVNFDMFIIIFFLLLLTGVIYLKGKKT
jgi:hypothetical protein